MSAAPPTPLLKRIPPGAWTALTWCAATAYPIVAFVWLPPDQGHSNAYPRNGLGSHRAQLLLALATALALTGSSLLRRGPRAAFVLLITGTVASTMAWNQTEIPPPQFLAVVLALGFITAARPRRTSLAAAAMLLGVLAAYLATRLLLRDDYAGTPSEPYVALTVVIAWLIGDSTHQARDYNRKLRAQAAAQAVTAERLWIARELHDMVAHSIGIIALQAGAARRVIDTQPARAREALSTIETTGRETLSGLRRMLGALRQAHPGQASQAASFAPGLGLADVDALAATTTAAGVRVEVRWRSAWRPLPPDIDMSAYRVIQEAVTNVVRHAGSHSCIVSIDCQDEELCIEVLDSGHGRGSPARTGCDTGWGLIGMRERVGLLHGEFCAEPRPEGGFRVTARLPVPTGVR